MKVDQRALGTIEVKVNRAKDQLRTLHNEMDGWDQRSRTPGRTWALIPEVHDNGLKHFFRLRFTEHLPVEWAVILGEAVHNLRSALDQCVFWLTIDNLGRDIGGTAFPVNTRKKYFAQVHSRGARAGDWTPTSGMFKIRGVGAGPRAFIESLQPYPQRRHFACQEIQTSTISGTKTSTDLSMCGG